MIATYSNNYSLRKGARVDYRYRGGRLGQVRRGRPPSRRRRGERSAPGLRPLSRPLIRSSRGRSGALVGWDGCEVRLCVLVPVIVPAPPGVFLPVSIILIPKIGIRSPSRDVGSFLPRGAPHAGPRLLRSRMK